MAFVEQKIEASLKNNLGEFNSEKLSERYKDSNDENFDTEQMTQKQNHDPQISLSKKSQCGLKLKTKGNSQTDDQKSEGDGQAIVKKTKKVTIKQDDQDKENEGTPALGKVSSNNFLITKPKNDSKLKSRKIKRVPSCATNIQSDQFQETGTNFVKKVQFNQFKLESRKEFEKQQIGIECVQFDQFYRKLTQIKNQEEKQPKQSFLHFLCSLLRLRKKKAQNKIQQSLLNLNKMKITKSKPQTQMLIDIFKRLIGQQILLESKDWTRIGFQTKKPFNQLQNIGVLTLLQWWNFISAHLQKSLKICNLCLELSCSLFNFHRLATKIFCEQLEKCNFTSQQWNEYQEYYNTIVLLAITQIQAKSRQSIDNIEKFMINALGRSVENVKKGSTKKRMKPEAK